MQVRPKHVLVSHCAVPTITGPQLCPPSLNNSCAHHHWTTAVPTIAGSQPILQQQLHIRVYPLYPPLLLHTSGYIPSVLHYCYTSGYIPSVLHYCYTSHPLYPPLLLHIRVYPLCPPLLLHITSPLSSITDILAHPLCPPLLLHIRVHPLCPPLLLHITSWPLAILVIQKVCCHAQR